MKLRVPGFSKQRLDVARHEPQGSIFPSTRLGGANQSWLAGESPEPKGHLYIYIYGTPPQAKVLLIYYGICNV